MVSRLSPEILQEIFKYLYTLDQNDEDEYTPLYGKGYLRNLYNCILVNRHWCKNAIHFIWQEPLNFRNICHYGKITQVYYSSLPLETKIELSNNNYVIPNIISKYSYPLFNYASFLKRLNFINLYHAVDVWKNDYTEIIFSKDDDSSSIDDDDDDIDEFMNSSSILLSTSTTTNNDDITNENELELKMSVFRELCVLFVAHTGHLKYAIEFEVYRDWIPNGAECEYRHDTFQFLQYLSNIIPSDSHLDVFECFTWWEPVIFEELSKVFSSIGFMEIHCKSEDNDGLATLIDRVYEIKELTIYQTRWAAPILTKAIRDKMYTVMEFHIISGGSIPLDILSECRDLKVFGMWQESDELQQYYLKKNKSEDPTAVTIESPYIEWQDDALTPLAMASYFKELTHFNLDVTFKINYQELSTIIRNTHEKLTSLTIVWWWNHEYDPDDSLAFFTTISQHCPNLTRLEITILSTTVGLIPVILNKCRKLKSLEFRGWTSMDISQMVQKIGDIIPVDLEYLVFDVNFICISSALKVLLKKCRQQGVCGLYLLFRNGISWLTEHIDIMKQYIELGVLHPKTHLSWDCWYNDDGTKSISI